MKTEGCLFLIKSDSIFSGRLDLYVKLQYGTIIDKSARIGEIEDANEEARKKPPAEYQKILP